MLVKITQEELQPWRFRDGCEVMSPFNESRISGQWFTAWIDDTQLHGRTYIAMLMWIDGLWS